MGGRGPGRQARYCLKIKEECVGMYLNREECVGKIKEKCVGIYLDSLFKYYYYYIRPSYGPFRAQNWLK